jgi:two-component system sensor histidine kinase KdpD
LAAFASQAAAALPTQRLVRAVQEAEPLRAADRTRTALLQAVSHDLRTPLASAKAAISSLRGGGQDAVDWSPQDATELLATVDESLDRLTRLVNNLLDMYRLQAGAVPMAARPVDVSGVVARALDGLGAAADAVAVSVPLDLPEVTADAGLIERVVANLVENALRFSAPDSPPMISASAYGDRVEIRIVDRGRGLDAEAKDRMFVPFQRLGDNSNRTGVELGLALARGVTEAMGGELTPEDTPGGGLTMVISLPAVTEAEHPAPAGVFP